MNHKSVLFSFISWLYLFNISWVPAQTINKSGSSNENSLLYALPRTCLLIEITYSRTTCIKGMFSEYSEKFLGYLPEIKENHVRYKLINIKVNSFTQPDPDHFYYLSPEKGEIKYEIIEEINKKGLIISTFKSNDLPFQSTLESKPSFINQNYIPYESLFKDKLDTIYKKEFRDSAWMNIPYYERKYQQKGEEDYAKEAANILIWLNEKLLKSSARLDPEDEYTPDVSEALVYSTRQMIEKYQSYFIGTTNTDTLVSKFIITPEKGKDTYIIGSFSENDGFQKNKKNMSEISMKISSLEILEKCRKEITDSTHNPSRLYYRIPEYCEISIDISNTNLFKGWFSICQYGTIIFLPSRMIISK